MPVQLHPGMVFAHKKLMPAVAIQPHAALLVCMPCMQLSEDTSGPASTSSASQQPQQQQQQHATDLDNAVLQNAAQFHKWHTELEAACASETEQKYAQYAQLLGSYLEACGSIRQRLEGTLALLDGLADAQRSVAARTGALSGGAEALMGQRAQLVEFGDALRARLRFFDEYEAVAGQFAAAAGAAVPDGKLLLPLLNRLEECIGYVAANPQYADAVTYATRFRQLQAKALGLVGQGGWGEAGRCSARGGAVGPGEGVLPLGD